MTRHNWYFSASENAYACLEASRVKRKGATCLNCGTTIKSIDIHRFEVKKGLTFRNGYADVFYDLDLYWHEELRPMAALAGLIEEANDSA